MNDTILHKMPQKAQDLSLRDLLLPLFRHKRLFALSFCGILLGTVLAAVLLSSQYKASMEVLVDQERSDPVVTSEATLQSSVSPPPVTEEEINSEVELLRSPDVLKDVVVANGLQNKERERLISRLLPSQDDSWYVSRATERLAKTLNIQAMPKTNLISVSYKAADPHLAYGVLKQLASLYLQKHLAVHRPEGSSAFFTAQTQKYHQALEESETRLADFGKESGVAAPDLERTGMAQQVVNSIAALHQARQTIAADERRIAEQETRMKAMPDRSLTQQISSSASAQGLLQQLQANLLSAQIKKTQLALKYDQSYPLVKEADQEIAQTQAAIEKATKQQYVNQTTDRDPTYELMREDIAKSQADLAFQRATAAALESSIHGMQSQMVDLDQKALRQGDLVREVKANEANYLLYLSKREQERTSDALDERRIGNVAIAVPPTEPVLPDKSPVLFLLVGLFLAVFVSTGTAFVAEYLDPSLRTPSEVVEVLRIPVLASVPKQAR